MSTTEPKDELNRILHRFHRLVFLNGDIPNMFYLEEAREAIQRLILEQDHKSHMIGFKNGKWAMAQKAAHNENERVKGWGLRELSVLQSSLNNKQDTK